EASMGVSIPARRRHIAASVRRAAHVRLLLMIRPSPVEPASPRSAGTGSTPTPAASAASVKTGYRSRAPVEIRTRPSLDVTLTGIVYCAMLLFMGLAAINTQANLLFGVFGLMIGVLLISGIISRWVLRHLT